MAALTVAGHTVDLAAVSVPLLTDLARAAARGTLPPERSAAIERVLPGLLARLREGRCGAPALNVALRIAEAADLGPAARLQIMAVLCEGDPTAPVHSVRRGPFGVRYQTAGRCAVPPDAGGPEPVRLPGEASGPPLAVLEPGETPMYVQRLLFWLEHACARFADLFGLALPAGDEPLDVCVTCGIWGAAAERSLVIANGLGRDLLCCVAVHELFHVFQQFGRMRGEWTLALYEGGAVFAEDSIANAVNRYLYLASLPSGLLAAPEQSVRAASYHAALLWRYIGEQVVSRHPGAPAPRAFTTMLKSSIDGRGSAEDIEKAAVALLGHGFARASWLDGSDTPPITMETVLGNFALACYLDGARPDARFRLAERDEPILFPRLIGEPDVALPVPPSRHAVIDGAGAGVVWSAALAELGHHYYGVDTAPGVAALDLIVHAAETEGTATVQVVRFDASGGIADIHRFEGSTYRKRISTAPRRLLIVVGSAGGTLAYHLALRAAPAVPDVMITRGRCAPGTEYEAAGAADPRRSPDVWVADASGAPGDVRPGVDNTLVVRAHNRADVEAAEVWIDLAVRVSGRQAWEPVRDSAGGIQRLRGRIAAHASRQWTASLFPPDVEPPSRLQVRATVTVPDDPNTDNKVAVSEFECVR